MPKFLAQIDAQRIPILGLVPESNSVAPATPVGGQLWYDSTAKKLKIYNATSTTWEIANAVTTVAGRTGDVVLSKTDVGLGNVDNTSDANKPVSTAQNTAISAKADKTTTVSTGLGLLGGGDLSANRSHSVDFATSGTSSATQAVRADDSRLSNSRTPSGAAGGDLTGTYPNPTVGQGKVTADKIGATAIATGETPVGGVAGSAAASQPALRALGTGANQALAGNTRLDTLAAPTAAVNLNGQKITSLGVPTNATDAATKTYVDGVAQGLRVKDAVDLASTGNIANFAAVNGFQDGDDGSGIMVVGARFLAKNQTNPAQNGIYVVQSLDVPNNTANMVRAADADNSSDLKPGTFVYVEGGTQAGTSWVTAGTNDNPTIGTDPINWTQFGGPGTMTAGSGLLLAGNVMSVDFAPSGTSSATEAVRADDSRLSNSRTPSGPAGGDLSGTYPNPTLNTVTVAKGGTGATTAAAARTALGTPGKYTTTVNGFTAGTNVVITHNLNNGAYPSNLTVCDSVGATVEVDVVASDANTLTLKTAVTIAGTFYVTVVG